ncbi:hypothetical protein BJ875DRAFT_509342 [Amylocarpus encephaloides]|uniref:C2H2-type domain-containing protein n=1 Tax=Amylocarpus encephaloides TaxID=45428 RepID=A0A9P7YJG1_9HELO|nr:hypothetical protein BJ875DRAFT_509342 [Amylocarpus encephaloides]
MPTEVPSTSLAPRPEQLLQYLPPYKVVVCTFCRYAIQPKAIARHLKEIHRIKLSDRQPFMQHVEKFELAAHELVMQYVPGEFPVPLLPVQSGLQCRSDDCPYLCKTEKRMKHHWLSVHRRQGLASYGWQTAPLQTFFKGNLLRYFTGTPSGKPTEITSQFDHQNGSKERTTPLPDPSLSSPPTSATSTASSRTLDESGSFLMEHFTTHVWLTLANSENMRQMWRDIAPRLAYQHEYLMHALLACAALHLAYLNPEQHSEWTIKARTHQDYAIPLFLAATPSVESETCDAVLIFVRLVGITTFALDDTLTDGGKEDKLPGWLFFIRSGCTMFCDVWDRIGTGPVRYLTESWELLVDISKSPLQPLLDSFLAIPPADWPEEVRVPYKESALALAQNFSCLHVLDERITTLEVVRFWPIKNSVEYVVLLENLHPGALILLAHYCIVLHRMSARSWSLKGTASSLLSTIKRQLDVTWHRYIEWPLSEVGLPPATQQMTDELPIGSLALSSDAISSGRGPFGC